MRFHLSRTVALDAILEGYGAAPSDAPWDQFLRERLRRAARASSAHTLVFDCPLDAAVELEKWVAEISMQRRSHVRYARARASLRKQIRRWKNHPAYRGQGMAEVHIDYLSGWQAGNRIYPVADESCPYDAVAVTLAPEVKRINTMEITLWTVQPALPWDKQVYVVTAG